jgi:hypothetical protein
MKSSKNKGKKKYIVALLVLAFLLIAILITGYQIQNV